jgi:ABC-type multidrug transport system permease subunit
MQYVFLWAINVFAVSPLVLAAVHYLLGKRLVWTTPVIVLMIAVVEFFVQVKGYSPSEPLKEQLRLYFHNDVSMGITIQYIPMIIVAVVCTLLYYFILKSRKTVSKKL